MKKMKCSDFCYTVILIITLGSKCLARPADSCDRSQGLYLHHFLNGTTHCCRWVECSPGSEVIVCQKPYTADQCRPCIPPLIQPDQTNSGLVVACYMMPICPEFSKPDENGQCQCDLDSSYYGQFFYDCTYVKCPEGQKLTKWGNCTFKNVDLVPIRTTPVVKLGQSPKDKNDIFRPDPETINDISHKGDHESTIEGDKNYGSYSTKKSVNNFGGNKTNDDRPEEVPVIPKEPYNYIKSFFYAISGASVPVMFCVLSGLIYVWGKHKKKHAPIPELPRIYKKYEKLSTQEHKWKPFPESILPLQLGFPGRSEFHKLPNIEPTPYASLPLKLEVGQSIGIIHMDDIPWGTGFMVGDSHVMTCFHTIYHMLGITDTMEIVFKKKITQLIDKVAISFHFNDADSRNFCSRFTFESCVPYFDTYLDVIVLKINGSCMRDQTLPTPLTKFCDFNPIDQFDLFGHPHGKEKQLDQYCRIQYVNSSKKAEMVTRVGDYLMHKGFNPQNFYDPYHGIQDDHLYTFTTVFVHGSSGSPGITYTKISNLNPPSYAVGTMLCGQYPKFKPNDITHDDLDPELTVQHGPKMSSVFKSMAQKNPYLLRKVFQDFPSDWDEE